jgi:hypothetical protein
MQSLSRSNRRSGNKTGRLGHQNEAERNVGLEMRNNQLPVLSNAAKEKKLIQCRLKLLCKEISFVREKIKHKIEKRNRNPNCD